MLPVMAAGLGSILFSIAVDTDYLNTPARNLDIPTVAIPLSISPASSSALLGIQPNQNSQFPNRPSNPDTMTRNTHELFMILPIVS